ncbi:tryptophan-rich sensory protein [Deinococcus metalli]|uniref:Tryptophan-rich sensory protein n=1 Tax=Deinococcus metalli TaxID=1141878 RepID=A0A7W8KHA8_9DEIO|nr:tryptophan-rich sensory protein [Deinococcus metalli]MBB5378107.1 tryptophan-rich sensory protein [Deinococcus metalli]GHF54497.1 putative TspO/MBR-related protein precursor [Deinococcus metalli]
MTLIDRPTRDPSSPTWMALVFALGTLLSGMVSAVLSFATAGAHTAAEPAGILPALWPPAWVFWAVWIVIYPAWGVATFVVWRRRRETDVRGPLVLYALNVLGALFFLPLSNLTANSPAVLTLLDANGLIGAYAMAWLYTRHEKRALWWLLPYLVWMPLTLGLKTWLWLLNS